MIKDGFNENTIITACYDGFLRIFDTRKMQNSVYKQKIGEQCWDFVYEKINENNIKMACASIYDAAYLANFDKNFNVIDKVKFNEHKTIVYGVDFIKKKSTIESENVVTCSFYDKMICIW